MVALDEESILTVAIPSPLVVEGLNKGDGVVSEVSTVVRRECFLILITIHVHDIHYNHF